MDRQSSFDLLHPKVRKWVHQQNWTELRDIQDRAIVPILDANTDIIISAATAGGKTEAAFLPACSAIAEQQEGVGILYISPLKALINDQYRRLEGLGQSMGLQVTPWHGDVSQAMKTRCKRNPSGILLITPESLESLLIRQPGWVASAFDSLKYIVIDEFHAFIGSQRGCQLLSLLHRLDTVVQCEHPIPRIALSATLGEMSVVAALLRKNQDLPCLLIEDVDRGGQLRASIRGYKDCEPEINNGDGKPGATIAGADEQISRDLYGLLRGRSHLVFANSRNRTEKFAARLSDLCVENGVPNEFFPHHGSLSKEIRSSLEARLQKEDLPTTGVCTMTLELGIDVGKVESVAQVTAPHSVSGLRQRLGRSGRRGDPAVLRMFIAEDELSAVSHPADKLRSQLLQSVAMLRLLLVDRWYEPVDSSLMHLSTFFHQILATIAQWGSGRADYIWNSLSGSGAFPAINVEQYKKLLRQMGDLELITQLSDGQITLGVQGERLVEHYTFFAVFQTPQEYRLEHDGKSLGTLPIDSPVIVGQTIVFAGRRWLVLDIDAEAKVIYLNAAKGGKPPKFGGGGVSVHTRVRAEMHRIYCAGEHRIQVGDALVDFLDDTATELLAEGQEFFMSAGLDSSSCIESERTVYLFPWIGDKIVNTLTTMLLNEGLKASSYFGIVEVQDTDRATLRAVARRLINSPPSDHALASTIPDKCFDKFDYLLSDDLLCANYAARSFDMQGALDWLTKLLAEQ